jgi:hypothetical protein
VTSGALDRVIRRPVQGPAAEDRCELCGVALPDAHAHLLDEARGEPRCACRACALLFEPEEAGHGQYRLVPDRRVRLTGLSPADLGVPVGLAFFVRRPDGRVLAHYPSPAGATQWEVDAGAWNGVAESCEPLRTMLPMVEALLVSSVRGADERWLVPIDDCYRLVALIRREWTGLSGGGRVWTEIERFFGELAARGGGRGMR